MQAMTDILVQTTPKGLTYLADACAHLMPHSAGRGPTCSFVCLLTAAVAACCGHRTELMCLSARLPFYSLHRRHSVDWDKWQLSHAMEHLSCFVGGMLVLGSDGGARHKQESNAVSCTAFLLPAPLPASAVPSARPCPAFTIATPRPRGRCAHQAREEPL